ncbi:hypothetical protein [Cellulomonas timonensis]|uniref:hypothetical protein n=1 Tax=Cellulomonas timonensis TaxID=1689271 RepID=UPI0008376A0D|nr:hypothetical protein [Cellulomonas timonensis]
MTCSSTDPRRGGRGRAARLVAVGLLAAALATPVALGLTSAVFIDDESASASFSTAPDFSAPRATAPGVEPEAPARVDAVAHAPTPTPASTGTSTGSGTPPGAGLAPTPAPSATEGSRPRR